LKDVTWYKFNDLEKNEFYAIDLIDEDNRAWHADINWLKLFRSDHAAICPLFIQTSC
jgi:hypothetical protein